MNPFETETMAELCLRQGHRDEAMAIYQRLLARAAEPPVHARLEQRLEALKRGDAAPAPIADKPLALPGLRARCAGSALTIEWRLPTGTPGPNLELLLMVRTAAGIATEIRSLPLDRDAGQLVLEVNGLHSARAAAGFVSAGRFVPLARS
ncbi:MAG TPA: hypothetical protein VGP07_20030 [Polyangia bacterium]|jgi:hypothetical protein